MKILIIGNGGREHALAWKCAQSQDVKEIFVAPGNAGTELEEKVKNIKIEINNFDALSDFAKKENIDLTIIGPETPLVHGIVDHFNSFDLACFGPSAAAAQLEGSKIFTKNFLKRHKVPTAEFQNFSEINSAIAYIRNKGAPIVIKADGLASGKGVIVAMTIEEAENAAIEMLSGNSFGNAGKQIVIEEYLEGEEVSFIVITDGKSILPLATSQDHKAINDGDTGPNTGGMGAYSPAPIVNDQIEKKIINEIIQPTLKGMFVDGYPYLGFLYAGLMILQDGNPKVIEFNCRLGDPETQPILMRLKSDLAAILLSTINGTLAKETAEWDSRAALGVVLAAGGYPMEYKTGKDIKGLKDATTKTQKVFHAGTSLKNGRIQTHGGRVLCVVGLGDSVTLAAGNAYEAVDKIYWDDVFYRRDIGHRAVSREKR
ncbi:MAG: phosphoribosylamine--glycine ligase [Gammaproteobacteria bacterium]|nr:phosphoribosylamine--glycine ligase [Gammaproteobacteria bacterium]|tara:strand:- start:2701 stop:3987 length:1287 start_codon:yes stop_codon:yes gene_type:complete